MSFQHFGSEFVESIGHQETSYIAVSEEISINLLNFIMQKSPVSSRFHISFRGDVGNNAGCVECIVG